MLLFAKSQMRWCMAHTSCQHLHVYFTDSCSEMGFQMCITKPPNIVKGHVLVSLPNPALFSRDQATNVVQHWNGSRCGERKDREPLLGISP